MSYTQWLQGTGFETGGTAKTIQGFIAKAAKHCTAILY
jgi:hypothetical protein